MNVFTVRALPPIWGALLSPAKPNRFPTHSFRRTESRRSISVRAPSQALELWRLVLYLAWVNVGLSLKLGGEEPKKCAWDVLESTSAHNARSSPSAFFPQASVFAHLKHNIFITPRADLGLVQLSPRRSIPRETIDWEKRKVIPNAIAKPPQT